MKKLLVIFVGLVMTLVGFALVGSSSQAAPKPSGTSSPINSGTNASPHFLPTSFQVSVNQDPDSAGYGDALLQYDVAGLGNGGRIWIRAHGVLTVHATCYKRNNTTYQHFLDHDVRVNEHEATGNKWGQYRGYDPIRKSAICPGGATSFTIESLMWESLGVDLLDYWDHSLPPYDVWLNTQPVGWNF